MKETQPFSPSDALQAKINFIPPEIIETVNGYLSTRLNIPNSISIKQEEIIQGARKLMGVRGEGFSNHHFFNQGWLEIESLYQNCGWKVAYHKPSYDESFEAYFEFTAKKTPE
jgi:hypothetical protein